MVKKSRNGFTLIEVIVVLIVLGIVGVFGSMFLAQIIKSYQFSNDNSQLTQKAQIAISRISAELSYVNSTDNIDADDSQNTITYSSSYPDGTSSVDNIIRKSNNNLELVQDGSTFILADMITSFDVKTNSSQRYFEIDLGLTGNNGVEKTIKKMIAFP